jgi:hypothetical protein
MKYKSQPTVVDGIRFASKAEARRYGELKVLERAGRISGLRLQPSYELQPAFRDVRGRLHRAIRYVGDFAYVENGREVVEDVKGFATQAFAIKSKMFMARYPGIELRVVK